MLPDFQTLLLPLLQLVSDGSATRSGELTRTVADRFHLTETERAEPLPGGQRTVLQDRVHWAWTYLAAAGLLEAPDHGLVRITSAGQALLAANPTRLDPRDLERFPAFVEFQRRTALNTPATGSAAVASYAVPPPSTPRERIEAAFATHQEAVKAELLARLKQCSPRFFERAVVALLHAMGYGLEGHTQVTGGPDGGIDGLLREDKLGLDVVCLQAKRYADTPVGRPAVQQFVGSLDLHRSRKGVILTTSTFTRDAHAFVQHVEHKTIILLDGLRLAALMLEHNVGVSLEAAYELKELSKDFFDEE